MWNRALNSMALAVLLGLSGCLAGGGSPYRECSDDSECPSATQCHPQGFCYGDLPGDSKFAAVLVPDNPTLYPVTEILDPASELAIDSGMKLEGRIGISCSASVPDYECIDYDTIATRINLSRAPLFVGGPTYERSIVTPSQEQYSLLIPTVFNELILDILPDDGSSGLNYPGKLPAEVLPPLRLALTNSSNIGDILLAAPQDTSTVTASIQRAPDTTGLRAWIRSVDDDRRISTIVRDVGTTTDFTIVAGMTQNHSHELVMEDTTLSRVGNDVIMRAKVPVDISGTTASIVSLASKPSLVEHFVPVKTFGNDGKERAVAGAEVTMTVTLDGGQAPTTFISRAYTDAEGIAVLSLAQTTTPYNLTILTPQDSSASSLLGGSVSVPDKGTGGFLPAQQLSSRFAVNGSVLRPDGSPVEGATVVVEWALPFWWQLPEEKRVLASRILQPTVTTNSDGEFVLYVDTGFGMEAVYDISVIPDSSDGSRAWFRDISLADATGEQLTLLPLALPQSYFVEFDIDPSDFAGELRFYQLSSQTECESNNLPPECVVPATLVDIARTDSDDEGTVFVRVPSQQLR